MTISDISLITIAGSLTILVLFFVGTLISILRAISLVKRDFHAISTEGRETIHNIKDITSGSFHLLSDSKKGKKGQKKPSNVMNWIALGITLLSIACKFFGKSKKTKKR
ncbi:MAG TPA: hypothetical protein VLF61_04550 [Rhabdochlamydiaceae bacterium]|nr:hypothetical protein [Rhabdochlamydiaceae bacterium]